MSVGKDRQPEGSLDPEQVGEASSFTFKELRAKLSKFRLVEKLEEHLLKNHLTPDETKGPPEG